jgi:hypothetical protein
MSPSVVSVLHNYTEVKAVTSIQPTPFVAQLLGRQLI